MDKFEKIREWMRLNRLKMNDKKLEFIMFGNNRQLDKCRTKEITIGDNVIQRAEAIKVLWVKLDKILSFKKHITGKCRKVTVNIHNTRKIRNSLHKENTKNLVYALVTSHMEYCSSLLIEISENTLKPVEKIQNIFRYISHSVL